MVNETLQLSEGYRQLLPAGQEQLRMAQDQYKPTSLRLSPMCQKLDSFRMQPPARRKVFLSVYDKITADNWEHKACLLPLLTATGTFQYVHPLHSLRPLSPWCQWQGSDRCRAEFAEDRVRKQLEYQRGHYDFLVRCSVMKEGQALPFLLGVRWILIGWQDWSNKLGLR